MAKGVTYTLVDSAGVVHTRYSAGHGEPEYLFAVVCEPGKPYKGNVSFCRRRELAQGVLGRMQRIVYGKWHNQPDKLGEPLFPAAAIYPVEARKGR